MLQQAVKQSAMSVTGCRMHYHIGSLVQYQQLLVFEDYIQREGFCGPGIDRL